MNAMPRQSSPCSRFSLERRSSNEWRFEMLHCEPGESAQTTLSGLVRQNAEGKFEPIDSEDADAWLEFLRLNNSERTHVLR